MIGLVAIHFMFGCSAVLERIMIVSLDPDSEIPPIISTSVNQNVDPSQYFRIAIVGITYRSIPTLETLLGEIEDAKIKGIRDLRMIQINSRADSDSALYPYFNEMTDVAEDWQNTLWDIQMQSLIEDHTTRVLQLISDTYVAYESQLLKYGFDVIERGRIKEVLQELNLSESGLVDDESAIAAGRLLAAQSVCLIEIYYVDGECFEPPDPTVSVFRESFKVVVVETGQIAFTGMAQNTVGGVELMFYGIAKKLRALQNYPVE